MGAFDSCYIEEPQKKYTSSIKRFFIDASEYAAEKNRSIFGMTDTWYGQARRSTSINYQDFLMAKTFQVISLPTVTVEDTFRGLCKNWREETKFLSSPYEMAMNESYQQIIGLGEAVVPLILKDLSKTYAHWFWALKSITRQNPVREQDAGDVIKMAEAWIAWGRKEGYIVD